MKLCGRAHKHMMYLDGYDIPALTTESLTTEEKPSDPESGNLPVNQLCSYDDYGFDSMGEMYVFPDVPEPTKDILLTFRSKISEGCIQPASRALIVGCIRTNAFVAKKVHIFFIHRDLF